MKHQCGDLAADIQRFSSAVESFLFLLSRDCTHYYDFPLILIKTCSAGENSSQITV